MNLSKNFTLDELTVTSSGLPNVPNKEETVRLLELVTNVLQPLYNLYGKHITIKTGFRTKEINKVLNGMPSSRHCTGEAVDIECADNAALFLLISELLPFDQLIWVGGNSSQPDWIHVSYNATHNRRQILRLIRVNNQKVYTRFRPNYQTSQNTMVHQLI